MHPTPRTTSVAFSREYRWAESSLVPGTDVIARGTSSDVPSTLPWSSNGSENRCIFCGVSGRNTFVASRSLHVSKCDLTGIRTGVSGSWTMDTVAMVGISAGNGAPAPKAGDEILAAGKAGDGVEVPWIANGRGGRGGGGG